MLPTSEIKKALTEIFNKNWKIDSETRSASFNNIVQYYCTIDMFDKSIYIQISNNKIYYNGDLMNFTSSANYNTYNDMIDIFKEIYSSQFRYIFLINARDILYKAKQQTDILVGPVGSEIENNKFKITIFIRTKPSKSDRKKEEFQYLLSILKQNINEFKYSKFWNIKNINIKPVIINDVNYMNIIFMGNFK